MRDRPRPAVLVVLAAIPLALSAATYYPIIQNYFYLDDFPNLYRIENLRPLEYLLTPHGGHILLTRNALFYLSSKLFGPNPSYFFWTVLLTHLLNVFLLFAAVRSLTGSARLACLGATLWGTSPLNEGTLGWYSVYGQAVVATVYLPVLIQACRLARSGEQASLSRRAFWILLALLGSASFGVGIGLAMSLPFVLLLILPPRRNGFRMPPLASLLLIVPVLYVGTVWGYSVVSGGTIPAGALANLFFGDWLQVASILFHLVGYGLTQLVLGFYQLVPSSFDRTISFASMASLGVLIVIALARGSRDGRRRLIACLLMVVSCYGTIAVGRAGFFSRLPMVGVVGQLRYHYVGCLTLTLLLCVTLANLAKGSSVHAAVKNVLLLSSLVLISVGFAWKRPAIDHHLEARRSTRIVLNWIRKRIADSPPGKVVYFFNKPFEGVPIYWVPPGMLPGWAGIYVIFYPENTVDGKPIRFVQRGGNVATEHGIRTPSLIIDFNTWKQQTGNEPPKEED